MRYIRAAEPPAAWRAKSDQLTAQLDKAKNRKQRNQIIDANQSHYQAIKAHLEEQSEGKCWFTEAKECVSYYEVEHFRPKKAVADGGNADGYWWLAFDFQNLRLCGAVPNRKKGAHFPLRQGCKRAGRKDDARQEEALLLDPTEQEDCELLAFDRDGEVICAALTAPAGSFAAERVAYTRERCNLTFHSLVQGRKAKWQKCADLINEYRSESNEWQRSKSQMARANAKRALRDLRDEADPKQPFSAVVRACVRSYNLPFLDSALQR
jgi:hypothetical protein